MKFFLYIVIVIVQLSLIAQERCLFDHLNPFKNQILNQYSSSRTYVNIDTTRIIPVIVHVFHRSDNSQISRAQVNSQINVLNRDFNRENEDTINTPFIFEDLGHKANFQFVLATKDPNGNQHPGINYINSTLANHDANDTRKLTSRIMWPSDQYLNIYVVRSIDGGGGTALGYAQQPGEDSTTDVVVIDHKYFGTEGTATHPFNNGRTAVHEVGHWLGLSHIWGNASEVGNFCDEDDGIDDTPNSRTSNYGCTIHPHVTCSNEGDMFMNYMDYSDDSCMYMFTRGQVELMHFVLQKDSLRPILTDASHIDTISYIQPEIKSIGNNFCDSSIQKFRIVSQGIFESNWILSYPNSSIDTLSNSNNELSLTLSQTGEYLLRFAYANDTLFDTLSYSFNIYSCATGINETRGINHYSIHENKIIFDHNIVAGAVQIFDISGKLIQAHHQSERIIELHLQAGIYIIQYQYDDHIFRSKFAIVNHD